MKREEGGTSRRLPYIMCLGYGALLASSPMTSATEVAVSFDLMGESLVGWCDQIAFVLSFMTCLAFFSLFSKGVESVFSKRWALLACVVASECGIACSASTLAGATPVIFLVVGSLVRGFGTAVITLAWFELFVDLMPCMKRTSLLMPASLLIAALFGAVVVALSLLLGAVATFVALACMIVLSYALLLHCAERIAKLDCPHLGQNCRPLKMPKTTWWIICVFGVALGCTWAVFYSIVQAHLSFLACVAFAALSVFLVLVGLSESDREFEFGLALRWSMLLSVVGFLLVPVLVQQAPGVVAFLLALAWAAQVLLLAVMPVQIASKLPVRFFSVAGTGGVAYGVGVTVGSIIAGLVLFGWGANPYAYSIITAVVGTCLVTASLYYPARIADASVLGMESVPENEKQAERLQRRCGEVAQKWRLTARESEILYQLSLGKTRSQIATEFNISEETVKTHAKHIYEKLGVHSLRELVLLVESGTKGRDFTEV